MIKANNVPAEAELIRLRYQARSRLEQTIQVESWVLEKVLMQLKRCVRRWREKYRY